MKKSIIIILDEKPYTVYLDPVSRKNLNIRIKPDNIIKVSKPKRYTEKQLITYLEDHKAWILKTSHKINELKDKRNQYITDETITIFGKAYLKENIGGDLDTELSEILYEYIDSVRSQYDELLERKPYLKVKKMRGKWGYCIQSKNELYFNQKLVHYPKAVIDYVILHEYTHLKIPNHSKEFYDFVEKEMPNYRDYIQYLQNH